MSDAMLQGEPVEVVGWFGETQKTLYKHWTKTTRHNQNSSGGGWACEIYHKCATYNEHLSIPCSLATEATEISIFLKKDWADSEGLVWFRTYLFLLSEFAKNLERLADHLQISPNEKAPN